MKGCVIYVLDRDNTVIDVFKSERHMVKGHNIIPY